MYSEKNIKFENLKEFISSAYHSVHEKDQIGFNTFLSIIYRYVPKIYLLL